MNLNFLQDFGTMPVVIFCLAVIGMLWIDLKAHSADKEISVKNAAIWSGIWIALSLAFAGYIGMSFGTEKASLFLAGYFLEKSLSVDNLFVIMAIFSSFAIADKFQHRVLYYGIIGALVLRMLFIGFGTALAALSHWVLFGFGIFVLWSALAMWKEMQKDQEEEITDYTNHWSVRMTKKFFRVHPKLVGHDFFTKVNGALAVTPLFLTLVCVEFADVMFAFDSVPAVIAVTQDPMLVYTSNIFAILGLRSLYFLLSAAKRYLVHLEKAVIFILVFIGFKMILVTFDVIHISPNLSLGIVLGSLSLGIVLSYIFPGVIKEEEATVATTESN
ncbi:TerC family protein [Patescibacteria group bacterium]